MNFKNLEKKIEKCNILKMRKNFNCLVFFKSDRPVCNHINVNLIKTTLKTIFSLKKSIFAFLAQKTFK